MADALKGQGQREQDQAKGLQATALQVGSSALSATTLAAAQIAIRAVQAKEEATASAEAIADLRKIRVDAKLIAALAEDLRIAGLAALVFLTDAIWIGYRTALTARAEQMQNENLTIDVQLTDADREALREFPALGHTPREIATSLIQKLQYDVDGALALPLSGTIDAETIPASIADVSRQHGQRLAGAVGEAYFAGVAAAVRDLGAALVGR